MNARRIVTIFVLLIANLSAFAESEPRLSDWMSDLDLASRPLNQVCIPGTHNSATSQMTPCSPIAKGQDISHRLNFLLPVIGQTVYCWSKAHDLTVAAQLEIGVRFFDLRVVHRDSQQTHWTVHGLYSQPIDDVIAEIDNFTRLHPKEIVLIKIGDLRHMTYQGRDTNQDLIQKFYNAFRSRYIGTNYSPNVTVGQLWKEQKQILIFYSNQQFINKSFNNVPADFLWSKSALNFPWINVQTIAALWQGAQEMASSWSNDVGNQNRFWGIGATISPNIKAILSSFNPFREEGTPENLRDIATMVNRDFGARWLPALKLPPFTTTLIRPNIITFDFLDADMSRRLIELNMSTATSN